MQDSVLHSPNEHHSSVECCMQETDTAEFERYHIVLKQAGRETNGKNEHFDRDQSRRSGHTQSLRQLANTDAPFAGLAEGGVSASTVHDNRVFMRATGNSIEPETVGEDAIVLDRVSKANRSVDRGTVGARMFYLVRPNNCQCTHRLIIHDDRAALGHAGIHPATTGHTPTAAQNHMHTIITPRANAGA